MKMDVMLQKIQISFFFVKTFTEKPLLIGPPLKKVPFTTLVWKLLNLQWKAIWVDWKNVRIFILQKEVREKQFCSWKKICKVISRTKNVLKLISPKGQHNQFKFGDGNAKWTNFKKVKPWETNPKKNGPWKSILGKRKPVQTTYPQWEFH